VRWRARSDFFDRQGQAIVCAALHTETLYIDNLLNYSYIDIYLFCS
jgi:hypothetical protein